jgi:MSHA biogenesis protein MshL
MKRTGTTEMRVSAGQVSSTGGNSDSGTFSGSSSSSESVPASAVVSESDANFWGELRTALETLIPAEGGRSIVVSPQTGVVVVRAMPNELREVEGFLRATQSTLQRQVILEAKIMEVILKDGFESGINWSKVASSGGDTITFGQRGALLSSRNDDSGVAGGIFSMAIETGSFSALIELLETQGNVQILSSPRVSTVNNQKAVIKVGQDEYFITDVSTTATTGDNPLVSPDVTLTPFFSGIALDVTPQIDNRGGITLHVHPSISDVQDQTKVFSINGEEQSIPTAQSTVRESDSIVYAVSGQIVVIGGLMQETVAEDIAAPPLLGDIPFFGATFRQTKQTSRKSELVILLKPLVVDGPGAWAEPIAQSATAIERLDRGFHYGGRSEVFGSKAEGR